MDQITSLDEYHKEKTTYASPPNAVQIACFENGESMLAEDGSIAKQECVDALNALNGLWKTSAAEIAKMNPKTAFNVLKSLGFQAVVNAGVRHVQPYSSWESSLSDAAKTNLGLKGGNFQAEFVKNVIAFVNANPAILNKGDIDTNKGADKYGVKAATWNKRSSYRNLDDVQNGIKSKS